MSFNDFILKYKLKNKATSNIKNYVVLKKIRLDSKLGIFLRDGNFSTNYGIVNLHPSKGSHWICYIKDCFIHMVVPHLENFIFLENRQGKCIYSEYEIQKKIVSCSS